jgi:hypothetical protein
MQISLGNGSHFSKIRGEDPLEDGDTTVGGGSSTPPVGGPAIGSAEWLRQLVADVVKGVIEAQKATSTTKTCPPVYTGVGGYSGNANAVQTWLLGNGYQGGFHAIGVYTATGYWGAVSASAYTAAMTACK